MTSHERAVATAAAAFPVPAWSTLTLQTYARALADLDGEALQAAVLSWIQSRNERPTVADLRRAVAGGHAAVAGTPYRDPEEAWEAVVRAIVRIGSYGEFPNDDPLVADVVRAIGWRTLCASDNAVADRAHFLQLYRGRLERARRDDATRPGAVPSPKIPVGIGVGQMRVGSGGQGISDERVNELIRQALTPARER